MINENLKKKILNFEEDLLKTNNDYSSIKDFFKKHIQSDFIKTFFEWELSEISKTNKYKPPLIVSNNGANFFRNKQFDYSIRILGPGNKSENIKWMGTRQILAIKGSGFLEVRILKLPETSNINNFVWGTRYTVLGQKNLQQGEYIFCENENEILDIVEVTSNVLLETLTIKNANVELNWNFDKERKSYMAEYSDPTTSRVMNILDLSILFKTNIDDRIISEIYDSGNSFLKIKLIEYLLSKENHSAFDYLDLAITSTSTFLSEKGKNLLNKIYS